MEKVKAGAFNPLPVVPIALVGANVDGKPNFLAVGFVNGVNVRPPIVYISLNKKHHTPLGIIENGTFSINIPSADHVVETDYCGLVSGNQTDKSELFTTFYGELMTAPMIKEFPITCECRYTGQKVEFEMDTLYFGEVVQVYINEDILDANRKIDVCKARPFCFSGMENRYRALGEDLGTAWSIGKQYKPRQDSSQPNATELKFNASIVDRPAQPALTIRSRVSPLAVTQTIGKTASAVIQYAMGRGYMPAGALFVAYHSFDRQELDIEIGFPFQPGVEGRDNIRVSGIPGGKTAVYRHVGPYEKLPEIRTALGQWLNASGFKSNGVSYEIYLNDPQATHPDKLETEILYPLAVEN
jgi:flavin reductase (DIM6/NTAB) family NADH-FMN oxidoreductase RutF/effector-binding domain-containing protein